MEPLELYKLLEKFKEFVEEDSELDPEEEIELLLRVNDLQVSLERIARNRIQNHSLSEGECDHDECLEKLDSEKLKLIYHDKTVCTVVRDKASHILRKRFHQDDH